jgi:hypothetical protein
VSTTQCSKKVVENGDESMQKNNKHYYIYDTSKGSILAVIIKRHS